MVYTSTPIMALRQVGRPPCWEENKKRRRSHPETHGRERAPTAVVMTERVLGQTPEDANSGKASRPLARRPSAFVCVACRQRMLGLWNRRLQRALAMCRVAQRVPCAHGMPQRRTDGVGSQHSAAASPDNASLRIAKALTPRPLVHMLKLSGDSPTTKEPLRVRP